MTIWKMWAVASLFFLVAGILHFIERSFFLGSLYTLLAALYFFGSRRFYKKGDQLDEIMPSSEVKEGLDIELKDLIAAGEVSKAIKRYREVTGQGLKEAKEYVDLLSEEY